jgi:DNA-binding FadR family transcriptional regulator
MKTDFFPSHIYVARSLHGNVVHALGTRIVGGTFAPLQPLPKEEVLCVDMGVSRTALREAMKVLAAKGLLESRPRVGTRVRPQYAWNMLDPDVLAWRRAAGPDAEFVQQLVELRGALSVCAAGLAARNRSTAQSAELRVAFEALRSSKTHERWILADRALFGVLGKATNNALFVPLEGMVRSASEGLRASDALEFLQSMQRLASYGALVTAIEKQDAKSAMQEMARLTMIPDSSTPKSS